MRTTLTLEPDVAALVKRAIKERKVPLKTVINDALRAGLAPRVDRAGEKQEPYRIKPFSVGKLLITNLDDTSEVLDLLDGPWRR